MIAQSKRIYPRQLKEIIAREKRKITRMRQRESIKNHPLDLGVVFVYKWATQESNLRPRHYQ